MGFIRLLAFAAALLLAAFPFPGRAQDTSAQDLEKHLGPLADLVELGKSGAWESFIADGWFNLANHDNPDAAHYIYAEMDDLKPGQERRIRVLTALRDEGAAKGELPALAGLIFDVDGELKAGGEKSFMIFVIRGNGQPRVYQMHKNGKVDFFEHKKARARMDGSDVLEIRTTRTHASLLLNGEELFTANNEKGLAPRYGIYTEGLGRMAFTGYSVSLRETGGSSDTPAPAPAPKPEPMPEPKPQEPAPSGPAIPTSGAAQVRFLATAGTGLGIFFHEFGHALIGETGLPATGPEEDAADEFSAIVLGVMVENNTAPGATADKLGELMAEYAVLFWYYIGQEEKPLSDWQDEHAPSLKRFRNMFCLLYGANPGRYEDIAGKVGLTDRTRARCLQEYAKRYAAWDKILASVSRNLGPGSGSLPADTPGGKISVTFETTGYENAAMFREIMGDGGIFSELMRQLGALFVLKNDLKIVFRDCQEVNAWYDPSDHSVTMCYNFMELAGKIVADKVQKDGKVPAGGTAGPAPQQTAPAPAPAPSPAPAPAPAPQPQPQAQNPAALLAGTWLSKQQLSFGMADIRITYRADGSYESLIAAPGRQLLIKGRWSASPDGADALVVTFTPQSWEPRERCDASGACQPITLTPEAAHLKFTAPDTLVANGSATFRREK